MDRMLLHLIILIFVSDFHDQVTSISAVIGSQVSNRITEMDAIGFARVQTANCQLIWINILTHLINEEVILNAVYDHK